MNPHPALAGSDSAQPAFFSPHIDRAQRFYRELNPRPRAGLVVVCGGWEHCRPDYAIHRAAFPYHSIEFVARGRGRLTLQGTGHVLQPGRVFAYAPGVAHDIAAAPEEPPTKYFVDFAGRRAPGLLRLAGLPPGSAGQVASPSEVQAIFDEIIRNGIKHTRQSGDICVKLLECLALKIAETRAPLDDLEDQAYSRYRQCREYMEAHFARLRSLGQIAAECHVDAAYLCRLFQRFDHASPYQVLLRLKMNQAADLLHQPGALIKQVAERVGFADPFHFSRAFKGVFGLSPDGFRRSR